jgi:tetratricopeptide (TPR) repeat protein
MRRDRAGLLDRIVALERRERTPEVRLALAEAEFRLAVDPQAGIDESAERLRRAITHDPFSAKAHLHLGRVLHAGGHRWAALAACRDAYRLAPTTRRIPVLAGLVLLELDRREREVGVAVLAAVAGEQPAGVAAAMAELDGLLESPAEKKGRKRRPSVPDGAPAALWRGLLHEQVAVKTPTGSWVRAYLRAGPGLNTGDEATSEVCAAAVLLVAAGSEPGDIRGALPALPARTAAGHPAARMLTAVLDLAEAGDGGFAGLAARLVESRIVPAEVVCALQFGRSDPDRVDAVTAVRQLDGYPAAMRESDCFRELRIAVLDAHARRAWSLERLEEAGILWRATVPMDPYRTAVAINLALIATRTRSPAYGAAWERAAELPYLHAAAMADTAYQCEDRLALHRALAEQSLNHSGSSDPSDEDIGSWVADGDAVEVWLRHWDLYYVNSRLRFRSPVHVLGAAPDAGPGELTEARDVLLRHLEASIGEQDWAGAALFCALARERVTRAWQQALDDPGGDPHRESEQQASDDLLSQAKRRVLLLHSLSISLRGGTSARYRRLLCAITRREFLLPIGRLHELCVAQKSLSGKVHLAAILEVATAEFAAGWSGGAPADPADTRRMLADLGAAQRAAPDRAGLWVPYGRLLSWSGREAEAYAGVAQAWAGLRDRAAGDDGDDARRRGARIRDLLIALADDIAEAELDRESSGADGVQADAVAAGRKAMACRPLSVVPAAVTARALAGTGEAARVAEAVRILSDRLRTAPADSQRARLRAALRGLRSADDAVRQLAAALHQKAVVAVRQSGAAGRPDATVLREAIADLEHAVTLARARSLGRQIGPIETELSRLRGLAGDRREAGT